MDSQTESPGPSMQNTDPGEERNTYHSYSGIPYRYKDCSLDTFQGNENLVSDLKAMADKSIDLFLTGNTGCGKTHLAIGYLKASNICNIPIISKKTTDWDSPLLNKFFITLPEILLAIRESFREKTPMTEADVVNYYADIDSLVLDDLGAEKPSEFSIATLYLILDRRIRNCRQTIITSNLNIKEIENIFGARIASRISEMRILKINMPDYRKRR